MEQLRGCIGYCTVWMCLLPLILQSDALTSALLWKPEFVDVDPISPVTYDFIEGNNRICISMSPLVTVVVTVTIVDPSLSYWVDKLPNVNIDLVQTRRTCYHDAGHMCLLLVITTTNSSLTEGVFNIFYNNVTTELAHGPIGFSDPIASGIGSHILLFHNNTAVLLYRQTGRESTANLANIRTSVAFRVCSNGELAHFQVSAFPLTNCRLGRNAGGYSVPYVINVVYAGFQNISGQQFKIVSSENCTSFSTSYHFIALDAALIATTTLAPAPITSPSPLPDATIDTSPAATNYFRINTTVITIAGLGAAVVLALIVGAVITIRLMCNTPPHTSPTSTSPSHSSASLDHISVDFQQHANIVPEVRNKNSITESTSTSIDRRNQEGQPSCCHHRVEMGFNYLNQSVDTLLQNQDTLRQNQDTLRQHQELILNNQDTMISNQEQQALREQDIDPELTESSMKSDKAE